MVSGGTVLTPFAGGQFMRPGQRWSSWQVHGMLALALGLTAGCAASGPHLAKALMADRDPAAHGADVGERYIVHCPDLLEVEAPGQLDDGVARPVGADGCIPLADGGRFHVEGMTPPEIARAAANWLGLPTEQVSVGVVEYNSQELYLFGEVAGEERAVPYQGPETVLDLLQRVGGVAPGAALGNVQVVRSHVADGTSPELFQVDLAAILLHSDQKTNVRLEPFDQVYIGQTKRSCLKPLLPPWLQPLYERLTGIRKAEEMTEPSSPAVGSLELR
jgi:polysaccharide biosynthesis/export protein